MRITSQHKRSWAEFIGNHVKRAVASPLSGGARKVCSRAGPGESLARTSLRNQLLRRQLFPYLTGREHHRLGRRKLQG